MGTVAEISLVWNKLQTGVIEPRPLILLGECWREVVECWQQNLVVTDQDVSILNFAADPEEACRLIEAKSPKTI